MRALTEEEYVRRAVNHHYRAGLTRFPAVPAADTMQAAEAAFAFIEAALKKMPRSRRIFPGAWQRACLRAHRAAARWTPEEGGKDG